MQPRKFKNRRDAKTCLASAADLGQAPTQWAHANGVDARSLNCWRLAIAGRRPAAPLRLVELVTPPPVPHPTYTVRFGGFAVEAPDNFDDAVLARLLRVVASAC